MADNGDVMDQIQKQLEGNTLGLTAVADVLQKMEARLEKAEEYEYEEDLMLAEDEQYGALIQGVAQEVIAMIKADNEVGIDVDEKKVGGTKLSDGSADDGSETVNPGSKGTPTADAQDTIVGGKEVNVAKMSKKLLKEDEEEEPDLDMEKESDRNAAIIAQHNKLALSLPEKYVSKEDFKMFSERMNDRFDRLEEKIDALRK